MRNPWTDITDEYTVYTKDSVEGYLDYSSNFEEDDCEGFRITQDSQMC